MTRRKQLPKASDVLKGHQPLFGGRLVTFAEAYPEIKTLRLEVSLPVKGPYGEMYSQVFTHEKPPGQYVDCTNPLCLYGGVDVGHIIRTMVVDRQTKRQASVCCKGREPGVKPCMTTFAIKVEIEFHDVSESSSGHQPSA
jgi:hypothetical protein